MINVTNVFLKRMKNIIKDKGVSPSDYVICFVCKSDKNEHEKTTIGLSFLIVPLISFENDEAEAKLPFKNFLLFKKGGCWISSDTEVFFHLISRQITLNAKGEISILKAPKNGMNSIGGFVGKCLLEHLENEKLTKKELALNLQMSLYKLNLILKGSTGNINLENMIKISFELQGKNKVSKYAVLVEKV